MSVVDRACVAIGLNETCIVSGWPSELVQKVVSDLSKDCSEAVVSGGLCQKAYTNFTTYNAPNEAGFIDIVYNGILGNCTDHTVSSAVCSFQRKVFPLGGVLVGVLSGVVILTAGIGIYMFRHEIKEQYQKCRGYTQV